MKKALWMLVLLGGIVAMAIAGLAQDEKTKAAAFQMNCPQGECCLWRMGLVTSGELKEEPGRPHPCPTGETRQGPGTLNLRPLKSSSPPCDEMSMLMPGPIPDGSELKAVIHSIRRKDDLAHLCGTFTIRLENEVRFEGEIELFHRVNTHWEPFGAAPCNPREQLQGWLKGKGTDTIAARDLLLRAMLVARITPLPGDVAGYALDPAHIDGVIIKCRQ